jgi:lathosterol oxidase
MILHLLGLPETPLNQFLVLTIGGFFLYFFFSGISYLIFFVWGRKRFHPTYKADPAAIRKAIKWATYGILGNVVLTMPLHWLVAHGWGRVYWHVSDYGVGWMFASFFLYLTFTETCIYWIHRSLHGDFLYRKLHRYHHEWQATTSWVSLAFHPVDSFAQALPHHLIIFILPVHGLMYLVMVTFVSVWAVAIHDRVSIVKWNLINYTGHHTLHHWLYRCNYGQFLTLWDRLGRTYRDPAIAARDGSVPEGVLR